MVKIMMHGCNGVMGQVISKIVEETEGAVMACGVDRVDDGHNDYPVFTDINACDVEVDAIIDFSAAPAVDGLLDFAVERQIPVVLCTTGLSDEQLERVHEASKKTAVLRSANMSLGVNTLFKVLKSMTKLLADAGFDIDIVEKHHRRKLDAPSGTAIALAEAVNEPLNNEYESYMTEAREENSVQRKRLESQQSVVERSLENMRSFLQDRMKLLSKTYCIQQSYFWKGSSQCSSLSCRKRSRYV